MILNLKYASEYFLEYCRIEVHFSLQFLVLQFKINHQGMVPLTYSDFMQRYIIKRFYQIRKKRTVYPHIVSAAKIQFIKQSKYCEYYLKFQQFPNSKKNSFRENYMRKYGM